MTVAWTEPFGCLSVDHHVWSFFVSKPLTISLRGMGLSSAGKRDHLLTRELSVLSAELKLNTYSPRPRAAVKLNGNKPNEVRWPFQMVVRHGGISDSI